MPPFAKTLNRKLLLFRPEFISLYMYMYIYMYVIIYIYTHMPRAVREILAALLLFLIPDHANMSLIKQPSNVS